MTTTRPPIESHETHSRRLMEHAFEQLEKGDRLQASEKAWGAVAHALKAIARERSEGRGRGERLVYRTHADAGRVILAIANGSPNRAAIISGFDVAEGLHRNFYEDVHQKEGLQDRLEIIAGLLSLLDQEQERWIEAGRPPTPAGGR